MIRNEAWEFEPKEDITTYELAQIVTLLGKTLIDAPHVWLESKPRLLRHFKKEQTTMNTEAPTQATGVIRQFKI